MSRYIQKGHLGTRRCVHLCVVSSHLFVRIVRNEGVAWSQSRVGCRHWAGSGRRRVGYRGWRRCVSGRRRGSRLGEVHERVFEGGEVERA